MNLEDNELLVIGASAHTAKKILKDLQKKIIKKKSNAC